MHTHNRLSILIAGFAAVTVLSIIYSRTSGIVAAPWGSHVSARDQ
jgi:hypothetical protein